MPTIEQITTAVQGYVDSFNKQDKELFLSVLAEGVRQIDPVGSEPNVGRAALGSFWDTLFSSWQRIEFTVKDLIVTGDEAALSFHITQFAADAGADVDGIDVFQVDDAGRIVLIKGYSDAGHISLRDDA
jgi:steroid delta-isomerase